MPEISVLMPVWNMGSGKKVMWLREAITSIVEQTFHDWELFLVDDGSTDDTSRILAEYADTDQRLHFITSDRHECASAAANRGLVRSTGRYIARMDADDRSARERFAVQKRFLDEHPDVAMCGTGRFIMDADGQIEREMHHPSSYELIRRSLRDVGNCIVGASMMCRREVLVALGGYSTEPSVLWAEDYELWVRMAAQYRIENIPGAALYYNRFHDASTSSVRLHEQESAAAVIMTRAQVLLADEERSV